MMIERHEHNPVLLDESIKALVINDDGIYLDGTFGRGGHAKVILSLLGPQGKLIAIDKDLQAIEHAKEGFIEDERFSIHHSSFANLKKIAMEEGVYGKINGIFLDLGVSSPQLDDPTRGFSFTRDGPLDMRMDEQGELDAATWINTASEEDIANVLYTYGEERFSRKIARRIVSERKLSPFKTTLHLAEVIKEANPAWEKHKHPATRSFQAIRIFINNELGDLEQALHEAIDILDAKGRLVIISFHSLEDRIVKRFLRTQEQGQRIPKNIPILGDEYKSTMKRIGKAIKPSNSEVQRNVRARSAVLRIGEKI